MQLYPLLPGESIELRVRNPKTGKTRSSFWDSWEEAEDAALPQGLDEDVYFGVAPRVPNAEGALAGRTENVARTPVLWMDLDAKEGFTKEARLAQLEEIPPTHLIDSGNGLHAYWLLDTPADPNEARRVMKGLAAYLQCDDTSDPPHILRWPGTYNHKDSENLLPVSEFVGFPTDRVRSLKDFPHAATNGNASSATNWEKRIRIISTVGIGEKGETIEDEVFQGRNRALFDLAFHHHMKEQSFEDILEVCRDANTRNRPPLSDQEVVDLVKSARSYKTTAPLTVIEVLEPNHVTSVRTPFPTVDMRALGEPIRPVYLWEPYFLLNRLVLLDGEEGIGKGLLLCMLGAKHSQDIPFVWLTAEDDPQDDIKPRIRSALTYNGGGGTLNSCQVHFMQEDPRFNADNEPLFERLEQTLFNQEAKVLVVDPGRSFIGPREGQKDFSYNNEADIRPTMQRLNKLSRDLEVAVIFVHHHNKNASAPLRFRTTGTGAWRQVVRHQVTMVWDYVLSDGAFGVQKSNIGPTGFVRTYKHELVDGYAVIAPSEQLDPAPELEIWISERTKSSKASILVMEVDDIVEQVRDWSFSNLKTGEKFPSREQLMKDVSLSSEAAKLALKTLREERWIVRPKGQQGGGYVWQPAWEPEEED